MGREEVGSVSELRNRGRRNFMEEESLFEKNEKKRKGTSCSKIVSSFPTARKKSDQTSSEAEIEESYRLKGVIKDTH